MIVCCRNGGVKNRCKHGLFLVCLSYILYFSMMYISSTTPSPYLSKVYIGRTDSGNSTQPGPLELFLMRAENSQLKVFIMTPVTILPIQDGGFNRTGLNQFNVVTLGTISSENIQEDVLHEFKMDNLKFWILYVDSSIRLPSRFSSSKQFPSHVFYYHATSDLLLHLVIFYKRGGNFIWSDSVTRNSRNKPEWLRRKEFTYGKYGASFDSIDTKEAIAVFGNNTRKVYIPKNIYQFEENVKTSRHVECNYTRADEFYKRTGTSSRPGFWSWYLASRVLQQTEQLLTGIGVRFVLSSGTLLGWYRQCGIIPYTSDLDIEVLRSEYSDNIIKTLKGAGFSHKSTYGKLDEGLEYAFGKYFVNIDMFFVYEEGEHYWTGAMNYTHKLRLTVPKYEMCWSDLLEVRVRIPCNATAYIEATYGSEWFKPKELWEWAKDNTNIKRTQK